MTYQTEFPDFVLDVTIPDGFVDASWHNDSMPSWVAITADGLYIYLFIDYADPEMSDFWGSDDWNRFALYVGNEEGMMDTTLCLTNDWHDILNAIAKLN